MQQQKNSRKAGFAKSLVNYSNEATLPQMSVLNFEGISKTTPMPILPGNYMFPPQMYFPINYVPPAYMNQNCAAEAGRNQLAKPATVTSIPEGSVLPFGVLPSKSQPMRNDAQSVSSFSLRFNNAPGGEKRKFESEEQKMAAVDNKRQAKKPAQNLRIFTGTVERVLKWHKINEGINCCYEVIASLISLQDSNIEMQQKILLLRDKKGPILQVVHYTFDLFNIDCIEIGSMLRCVGIMTGPNMLRAFAIRPATEEEIASLQRLYCISDHAISRAGQN